MNDAKLNEPSFLRLPEGPLPEGLAVTFRFPDRAYRILENGSRSPRPSRFNVGETVAVFSDLPDGDGSTATRLLVQRGGVAYLVHRDALAPALTPESCVYGTNASSRSFSTAWKSGRSSIC